MRTSILAEKVLEVLWETAKSTADIFELMLSDRKTVWRAAYGFPRGARPLAPRDDISSNRQKLYNLLSYLKRQGLIDGKKQEKTSFWKLTPKGIVKLKTIKEQNLYSPKSAKYAEETDATFKLVMYDIPVKERRGKRHWIRWALQNMGFVTLQKSVWMGKKKIPEQFLKDLHARQMLKYVHIMEITKKGTVRESV